MMKLTGIKACVFDAYGTLFDVHAAVGKHKHKLGAQADPVSMMWRTKQLEYTWLRSLMRCHEDFWQITQDGLDYALDAHSISDDAVRKDLLDAYWKLDAYPEVADMLRSLKDAGLKCAILSNGSMPMLQAAVDNAGIGDLLDGIYSVDEVGINKPDPSVYELATKHLGVSDKEISFQSSNAWDAVAAAHYGFNVVWINRFGQRRERLPAQPDIELTSLEGLVDVVAE
ncbi:MAG: haloacid dehalogenase type II [Arenicellales bacterium WSBS_2016_MAG_OTU3]